ncbi:unannotated protein [freshwater metagenome]|uniref:Unannotated protein n=1 Tax=freshwater metagenome TaxID=449393 RepID=A0A6J7QSX8_9ZZZZ
MACPCTAATVIASHDRHHVKASWYSEIVCKITSSVSDVSATRDCSPGTPSGVNMRRSSPAENVGPSLRSTTARTEGGSQRPTSASAVHMVGVCAFRTSGLARVTMTRAPSWLTRIPPASNRSDVIPR